MLRKDLVYADKNGWSYLNDPLSAHFNYIDGRITRGQYFMSTRCLLWGQFFKFLLLESSINLLSSISFPNIQREVCGPWSSLFIVYFVSFLLCFSFIFFALWFCFVLFITFKRECLSLCNRVCMAIHTHCVCIYIHMTLRIKTVWLLT